MNTQHKLWIGIFWLFSQAIFSAPEQAQQSVWVNEAIVATYSYSYKNYLEQQRQIAKYFTADGWMAYSKALNASKLPDAIQKNLYFVSAVATTPPVINAVDASHWHASMNLLVIYANPQYQQRQYLKVEIGFTKATSGQGVRGYSITSLKARETKPSCRCIVEQEPSGSETPRQ